MPMSSRASNIVRHAYGCSRIDYIAVHFESPVAYFLFACTLLYTLSRFSLAVPSTFDYINETGT